MADNTEKPPPTTESRDSMALKLTNFWVWIMKSEQSEGGRNINLDKRIPGFASLLAVILFLAKEFVHHESDQGFVFTDLNFTISLQALNIVVLLIILIRGLKISKISKIILDKWFRDIRFDNIELLESYFIKYVKLFFGMTILLYCVLIVNTLLLDGITHSINDRQTWLDNIRQGRREVNKDAQKLRNKLSDTDLPYLSGLSNQLDTINESMKEIVYNDEISIPEKSAIISHLHKINEANKLIGKALLSIDEYLNHGSLVLADSLYVPVNQLIKGMYHGNHLIDVNSKIADKDNIEMVITHILELIFSNLGALSLVYSFLVLYTKNTITQAGTSDKSLLSMKYLLTGHYGLQSKRITRLLVFLFGLFIVLTILQIILEFSFQESSEDISTLFTIFSGIFNALALSLLVARFESSTFNSTFSVLVILYLYANIQVLFGVFNIPLFKHPHLIEDITLLIAFLGKCFLYLYILWILRTDRLKFYFYNRYFNNLPNQENYDWAVFIKNLTLVE